MEYVVMIWCDKRPHYFRFEQMSRDEVIEAAEEVAKGFNSDNISVSIYALDCLL